MERATDSDGGGEKRGLTRMGGRGLAMEGKGRRGLGLKEGQFRVHS